MAYATNTDVATYLGRSLSVGQQAQTDFLLDAASAWIDQYTGRVYSTTSPATELNTIVGPLMYLKNTPVLTVSSVNVRAMTPGAQNTPLEAGSGYELLDASKGIILFGTQIDIGVYSSLPWLGYIASIVYTYTGGVPANIKLATILLAAYKLQYTLNPMSQRIRSLNDNRAISVTFQDEEIPPDVFQWLPRKQVFIV